MRKLESSLQQLAEFLLKAQLMRPNAAPFERAGRQEWQGTRRSARRPAAAARTHPHSVSSSRTSPYAQPDSPHQFTHSISRRAKGQARSSGDSQSAPPGPESVGAWISSATRSPIFLWPACQWERYDPTQPMPKWDAGWRALRVAADLPLPIPRPAAHRDHEACRARRRGSRAGIDQRPPVQAHVGALLAHPHRREAYGDGPETPRNDAHIPLLVALSEGLTSQSRHSLRLAGSPPSAKLSVRLERRDVRVV